MGICEQSRTGECSRRYGADGNENYLDTAPSVHCVGACRASARSRDMAKDAEVDGESSTHALVYSRLELIERSKLLDRSVGEALVMNMPTP